MNAKVKDELSQPTNNLQSILVLTQNDQTLSSIRKMVITSVLDENPPCVGVGGGGSTRFPGCLVKWTKFVGLKIRVVTFI